MIDVIDMIPSRDLREALRESGREFTDMEKATIIHNLRLTPERTRELLEQLEEETDDESLRAQLRFRLAEDERLMKRFREDTDGFVFGVTLLDEDYREGDDSVDAYFSNFSVAYEFGSAQQLFFEVSKWRVYDRIPEGDSFDCETCVGFLRFDEDGELVNAGLWDIDEGAQWAPDIMRGEDWPHFLFFEDRWLDLPNLYERGDVVRVLAGQVSHFKPAYDWAVVNVDASRWEEFRQRVNGWLVKVGLGEDGAKGVLVDFSDMQVFVEVPCKDGTFVHAHINPMFLERFTREVEGDEAELQQMATWAAKGECGLDWMSHVLRKRMLADLANDE